MNPVGIFIVSVLMILLIGTPANGYPRPQHGGGGGHIPWSEYNPFSCTNRAPGYYADYSRACQKFYRCVENFPQPFQFECGEGTRFDERINNCNHAAQVHCY